MLRVDLELSRNQVNKIRRGLPIQISHAKLMSKRHWLALHPESAKKVIKARRARKGVRLHVTPEELHMSGEGLKEFFDKIKQGASWVKQHIIDTPLYQQNLKPIVHTLIDKGLQLAAPTLGPLAPVAVGAAHLLENKTGLGVRRKRRIGGAKKKKRVVLNTPATYSDLLPYNHPARHGGSFRAI